MADPSSRRSFRDKVKRVCKAPFRSTLHSHGLHWMGVMSHQDIAGQDDSLGEKATESARPSMSKDGGDPPHQGAQWRIGGQKFFNMPTGREDAWDKCTELVNNHDTTLSQDSREEIDSLLVFAGLFSGVCTAFIIESYKWMMEQPDDLAVDYLRQILVVLTNTTNTSFPQGAVSSGRPSLPNDIVALINGLWFNSLVLSLSSALVGIVSKQWLREYIHDAGRSHITNLSVRQVKYDGLRRWYVGVIIALIPVLLQAALFLFLVGIIYLLWHLQPVVAGLVSGLVGLIASFFILTTILPAGQFIIYRMFHLQRHNASQIPFKSAQAWIFLQIALLTINFGAWIRHTFVTTMRFRYGDTFVAPYMTNQAWSQLDLDWTRRRDKSARAHDQPSSVALCLGFIELNFEHAHLRDWIWNCLWSLQDKAASAKYVLQCARSAISGEKSDFPSPEDGLASTVLPLLGPKLASQATTEMVLHTLLPSSSETRVEHIIRVYNSLVDCGIDSDGVPRILYDSLRITLSGIPGHASSNDTRLQLFYVARDILRRNQHTEVNPGRCLQLLTTIITHLGRGEVEQGYVISAYTRNLSLALAPEIMNWLSRYPEPGRNWRAFKSRVLWATQSAVFLARRIARFTHSDRRPAWHPRLPAMCALFATVDLSARMIPPGTLPTWQSDEADMDIEEFTRVKGLLEDAVEAGSDHDSSPSQGADVRSEREERSRTPSVTSTSDGFSHGRGVHWGGVITVEEPSEDYSPSPYTTDFSRPIVINAPSGHDRDQTTRTAKPDVSPREFRAPQTVPISASLKVPERVVAHDRVFYAPQRFGSALNEFRPNRPTQWARPIWGGIGRRIRRASI
ncbi:uncharacterized protein SCHCODRAFT_02608377 [Schizophyllum commune H4-8]|nr:uncharacterized protein SCHCODRAFT_02608377 [Schizophyllum commune H4-8]KAI5900621.1 hypothetical protein SCHCODRAFT_02608377 [Schizophyllum commune H4-8]